MYISFLFFVVNHVFPLCCKSKQKNHEAKNTLARAAFEPAAPPARALVLALQRPAPLLRGLLSKVLMRQLLKAAASGLG